MNHSGIDPDLREPYRSVTVRLRRVAAGPRLLLRPLPRFPLFTSGLSAMLNTKTAPYAALLLRVSLGFLAHVGLKLFVFTVPGFVGYFASLGLPAIAAYLTIALELLGGIALIFGIFAPWVALPLAAEMFGTIVLVHGANGWLFTAKGGGWEYPAFWTVALLVLFLLGDGAHALRPVQRNA